MNNMKTNKPEPIDMETHWNCGKCECSWKTYDEALNCDCGGLGIKIAEVTFTEEQLRAQNKLTERYAMKKVLKKIRERLDYWLNHRSPCGTRTDSIQELRRIEDWIEKEVRGE